MRLADLEVVLQALGPPSVWRPRRPPRPGIDWQGWLIGLAAWLAHAYGSTRLGIMPLHPPRTRPGTPAMRIASLFALALLAGAVRADAPVFTSSDPAALARVKKDLFFLAGPECEGRGTETEGIKKAAEYVRDSFKQSGLKSAGTDGYFQPFDIKGPARLGTPNALAITGPGGERELVYGKEFTPTGLSGSGKVSGDLVFAGYGIDAPSLKFNDYAGLDVAGKIVIVLRRTPNAEGKDNPFEKLDTIPAALSTKVALAKEKQAKGLIFVNDSTYGKNGDTLLDFRVAGPQSDFPVLHMKRAQLDALLVKQGTTLKKWEKEVDESMKPDSLALKGVTATAEATVTRAAIPTRNVVAVSEGSGPLANETVVIGAHYDHLGFGERGSLGGKDAKGQVHYGADDNGSGTTGLLELARRIGKMANRQGRRIVFVAFAGEERGLFGSIHYCKEPPFPLADTVFMLNMDMIGRVTKVAAKGDEAGPKKDRVVIYGLGTAEGLEKLVDAVNARLDFLVLKVAGGTGPSDHDSFYRKKIPVLFFFTGTHKDYHKPTDTPDKVNYPGLLKIVDFVETILLSAAADPVRPKYLVTKGGFEDPTEEKRASRPQLPKLGIMPGNYEATEGGVLIEGVTPGGAAEKGGVKDQDVIVGIGGKPVKDIQTYMSAMQAQKPGLETEVVVLRGGKKVTLKVTPTP